VDTPRPSRPPHLPSRGLAAELGRAPARLASGLVTPEIDREGLALGRVSQPPRAGIKRRLDPAHHFLPFPLTHPLRRQYLRHARFSAVAQMPTRELAWKPAISKQERKSKSRHVLRAPGTGAGPQCRPGLVLGSRSASMSGRCESAAIVARDTSTARCALRALPWALCRG